MPGEEGGRGGGIVESTVLKQLKEDYEVHKFKLVIQPMTNSIAICKL